jgi:hypothetical protein
VWKFALPIGLNFLYDLFSMKSISDIPKKKRGRPATGKDPMLTFRAPPETIAALDAAASADAEAPSRSELVRRIVADWLRSHGYLR